MPAWLANLNPNIQMHDTDIMSFFLSKFTRHILPMMPIFQDVEHSVDFSPGLVLATAAVGGLFCPIEGSFQISLAMYSDARRLALSRVSDVLMHIFSQLMIDYGLLMGCQGAV